MKRSKARLDFARMRVDLQRARDAFGGIRILCDALPDEFVADPEKLRLLQALAGIRLLAVEAEVSLGAAERKGHETLYPPRYA